MVTILYIEDAALNRRLVQKCLKTLNYRFLEATDGLSGVEKARTEIPDLILIDYHLPDIDGIEVARLIRQIDALKHTPLIALTADMSGRVRDTCLNGDFDEHLTKPISRAYLIRVIEQLLKARSQPAY